MKNRWNYNGLGQVTYGHEESYREPIAWFDELGGTLEDWGCGCCGAKRFVKRCQYIGIEGSKNEFADRCDVDLTEYLSQPDHILLRDVLDHNPDWQLVLTRALASFQKRMVVVIFRECGPQTRVIFTNTSPKYPGVPDYQFKAGDLVQHFYDYLVRIERYGNETAFYLQK